MEGKAGYATTTYRLKLHCKHLDWIKQTKSLYNEVILFYHRILMEKAELLDLGNMNLLRRLEQLSIVGRDKKPVESELPFQKVPVYFRRAAINAAIGYGRSYCGLVNDWEQKQRKALQEGNIWKKRMPSVPSQFHASPLLYQGMYKQFGQGKILIKLWNGKSWAWVKHSYSGRSIGESVQLLSPTLVLRKNSVFLHVPVVKPVEDIRTVRERVRDGERYCAVSFTASDVLATCVLFSSDGHATDSYFIRGGKEFAHRRKRLLNAISKKRSRTGTLEKGENKRCWERFHHLGEYYAHLVSKRILDYCKKNEVKLLVVPQFTDTGWRHIKSANINRINLLFRRVIQYTKYKMWNNGIIMTAVRPYYASAKCSHCQEEIKRYNEGHQAVKNYYGGRLFVCQNGHKGSTSLNFAKNIASSFYQKSTQQLVAQEWLQTNLIKPVATTV